tara:strand:+ start:98 stop:1657 length:1560 start_codon:yes stop_codon:yes gene_type:complete
MISKKKKEIFYIIFLFLFSISFNQYIGYLGVNPIDTFSFNSGYDILNGHYPFRDYWTITGPFIALTQAFFFKVFNISWFSYVFHASIFNFIFVICTFYTLYNLKLSLHFSFFYSLLVAVLAYPSSGTPYVDHQASYLSIISIYCFILALKTNLKIYWFFLPLVLGISFLTKQTPTAHFSIIIAILSIIYFIFNFNIKKIIFGIFGFVFFISIFLFILFIANIPLITFFDQYILYPLSIGEGRLDLLFPLEFQRLILRFKLIHFFSLVLIIISIIKVFHDYKFLKSNDFLIIISLVFSSFSLIVHQLMTVNGLYVFFIIPILAAFAHIYFFRFYKNKNYFLYLLIFLSIGSTIHYANKYIFTRDFADLRKVNKKNAIKADVLDKKLSGLKWITPLYPNNPKEEISQLQEVILIIKDDKRNKSIITDYQFISVILSVYDNSPSQVWFINHILNQEKESKYFKIYKKFFDKKLKENEVEIIYLIKPLWGGNEIIDNGLNKDCIKKTKITEILDSYLLKQCVE